MFLGWVIRLVLLKESSEKTSCSYRSRRVNSYANRKIITAGSFVSDPFPSFSHHWSTSASSVWALHFVQCLRLDSALVRPRLLMKCMVWFCKVLYQLKCTWIYEMFRYYPNALEFTEHDNYHEIQEGSDSSHLTFSLEYLKGCPAFKKQYSIHSGSQI